LFPELNGRIVLVGGRELIFQVLLNCGSVDGMKHVPIFAGVKNMDDVAFAELFLHV
jgi:hypothetical protein